MSCRLMDYAHNTHRHFNCSNSCGISMEKMWGFKSIFCILNIIFQAIFDVLVQSFSFFISIVYIKVLFSNFIKY